MFWNLMLYWQWLPPMAKNRNWGWQVFDKFMINIWQPFRLCGWHKFVFTWWAVDNAKLVICLSFWQMWTGLILQWLHGVWGVDLDEPLSATRPPSFPRLALTWCPSPDIFSPQSIVYKGVPCSLKILGGMNEIVRGCWTKSEGIFMEIL